MSSVYKKGRDGYYYYQTYVFNPETKKKDKRVFHALRTKDLAEAKAKQYEFDMRYENHGYDVPNTKKLPMQFSVQTIIFVIVVTVFITIFAFDLFKNNKIKQPNNFTTIEKKDLKFVEEITAPTGIPIVPQKDISINGGEGELDIEQKTIEEKIVIPKYNVERVERLSNAFAQGKIYVTIDQNSSYESQRLLCKELVKKYIEFSNIVICLYANNRFGKDLARGNDKNASIEKQKQSWLAMYTYNVVEGEYFDDNPSGYMGIY